MLHVIIGVRILLFLLTASSLKNFNIVADNVPGEARDKSINTLPMVMFSLPFIDQKTKEQTRRQLQNLSAKIVVSLHPVFSSKKVGNIFKTREPKPKIISEQCVI